MVNDSRASISCTLPGKFGEAADQFLIAAAHLQVGDLVGVEVEFDELAEHLVQQVGPVEACALGVQIEVPNDGADLRGEACDVDLEVVGDVVGVVQQFRQVELRDVPQVV